MTNANNPTSRLVSCEWLADHLNDPNVRVLEVSSSEDDSEFRSTHIPGSYWWNWKDALWHDTDREFATPEEMAQNLGSIGVSPETTLVICGSPVQYGSYAIWVLTMAGHPDVRMLEGGRSLWTSQGRALTDEVTMINPVEYDPQEAKASSRVGRDDVLDNLGKASRILLDVRSPEEYSGDRVSPPGMFGIDHGAERKGRIPGAVHLHFRDMLNDDDTFKSPTDIRRQQEDVGVLSDGVEEIVSYCRLSHRATLAWFAMTELLGMDNVRIYDGSWTEWGSIVGFPVERP